MSILDPQARNLLLACEMEAICTIWASSIPALPARTGR